MNYRCLAPTEQGDARQGIMPAADQPGNLQAALARTVTRGIALYFSRPVRLFRPSKVSGWHTLRGLASHHGTSLTPQYLYGLVRNQGLTVIPKHFIPPMVVNALLGTVLWSTYTTAYEIIEPLLGQHPTLTTALSGAIAGGMQAFIAAPAENVRLILEGSSGGHSWSHAWQEVFKRPSGMASSHNSTKTTVHEIRELRNWWKDVGEMAGRGWEGWGWGCIKDMCGFAVFFSIFEITRRTASYAKDAALYVTRRSPDDDSEATRIKSHQQHLPRIIHSIVLVAGGATAGFAYEKVCRPWDVARHMVQSSNVTSSGGNRFRNIVTVLLGRIREDGLLPFIRDPDSLRNVSHTTLYRQRLYKALRTLGRVGPWGIGFLVWEAYGPGLS
ncbi:hypothetical protein AMATHDRAFT_4326 [Amanita thiersii Skay4041]|uniref:Mitochondrial carrier protein n=1 Tax=Amanita thiersii Skay4041 TaxID=703135 RepID=A0A2A9NP27_9AGAR|nr:hypothetical protein AMATHDRAFT_4326 [Amanita thiersii Skay4041]